MNNFSRFWDKGAVLSCLVYGPGVIRADGAGEPDKEGGWGVGSGLIGLYSKSTHGQVVYYP